MQRHVREVIEDSTIRIADPCALLRRASRAVSHLYDLVLSPTGLKATQFILLDAIYRCSEVAQWRLADEYGLADDTLSRRLATLRRAGLVRQRIGNQRPGERLYQLTPEGLEKYEEVRPYWKRAQERLRLTIDEGEMEQLLQLADSVVKKASAAEFARCSNVIPEDMRAAAAAATVGNGNGSQGKPAA